MLPTENQTQRALKIIEKLGLTDKDFSRKMGFAPQNVNNWRSGKGKISPKIVILILETWPNINCRWLLFGSGQMFNNKNENHNNIASEPIENYGGDFKTALEKRDQQIDKLIDIINNQMTKQK